MLFLLCVCVSVCLFLVLLSSLLLLSSALFFLWPHFLSKKFHFIIFLQLIQQFLGPVLYIQFKFRFFSFFSFFIYHLSTKKYPLKKMFNFIAKLSPAFSSLLFFLLFPSLAINSISTNLRNQNFNWKRKQKEKLSVQCVCVCVWDGGRCVCVCV